MDDFKKKNEKDLTAWDMNCRYVYIPRTNYKQQMRRLARRRLKREDAKEINNEGTGEKN